MFNWLKPDGEPLMTETRKMIFYAHPELRIIDFEFDFAAVEKVVFRDTKEGTFAMRVATALDEPPARPRRERARENGQAARARLAASGKRACGASDRHGSITRASWMARRSAS